MTKGGGVCMVKEVCIAKGSMHVKGAHVWPRGVCMVGGGMYGEGGVHGKGEHTWQRGDMHGKGCGACVVRGVCGGGGMCGRGWHAWQGGMYGKGGGACVARGEGRVAGETATEAGTEASYWNENHLNLHVFLLRYIKLNMKMCKFM